jgi:A/G-specific adenine glycosylase
MKVLLAASESGARERSQFQSALLGWYDANRRSLPWRRTRQPYRVWVSEIMLQQTRVAAVIGHYKRFIQQFPTVDSLSRAREQQVLAAWSGLGYYRRARMLHRAAKLIVKKHDGRVPGSCAELERLPGIGRYTAAAIASIAFRELVAVVDGNVKRVLARIAGKELSAASNWDTAQRLLDGSRPGDFNQAMMELGATVCLPEVPLCVTCPIFSFCKAQGEVARSKRSEQQRRATKNLLLIRKEDSILLTRRPTTEPVMPGMWDLPEHPQPLSTPVLKVKHSILNTDFRVSVFSGEKGLSVVGRWIAISRLPEIPLTGMARKVLRKLNLLQ